MTKQQNPRFRKKWYSNVLFRILLSVYIYNAAILLCNPIWL